MEKVKWDEEEEEEKEVGEAGGVDVVEEEIEVCRDIRGRK